MGILYVEKTFIRGNTLNVQLSFFQHLVNSRFELFTFITTCTGIFCVYFELTKRYSELFLFCIYTVLHIDYSICDL